MSQARPSTLLVVCLCFIGLAASANSKVAPGLLQTIQRNGYANILVSMRESTDATLNQVVARSNLLQSTKAQRSQAVYDSLTALAGRSQTNVLNALTQFQRTRVFSVAKVKSFWITNQIYVSGADQELINLLAGLDDVSKIEEEEIVHLVSPVAVGEPSEDREPGVLAEWGVDKILTAQAIAALGTNGRGVVVGIIDTGARHTHQDIRGNFRGGTHSWFFPNGRTANPVDGHGHGTHVTGTAVGANGLGVAPGAEWISCKGLLDNGSGSFADLIACGEFMACPHDYNGGNPNCALSADIVSNSWGGAGGSNTYDPVIRAWHAAGIVAVFANGNYGLFDPPKACRYTGSPADSVVDVIAVGATASNDGIADFSYRGPSRNGAQSPHVSAPGVGVRSAWVGSDSDYNTISGTSMATPHVAGLAALLRSHSPNLTHVRVKQILQDTSDRNVPTTGETCDGVPDTQFPNYQFGYGRVNALRAANALIAGSK